MAKRAAVSAETRGRILKATRRLLARRGRTDLGLDAIARASGISRVTIYNHFGSRSGLLEALYDYLATTGNVRRGREALAQENLDLAIGGFIRGLVGFWSSDATAIRRLHAMAALDAAIEKGLAVRQLRRKRAAAHIVRRFASRSEHHPHRWTDRLIANTVSVLASFETYDALASAGQGRDEIVAVLSHLVREILLRRPAFPNRRSSR